MSFAPPPPIAAIGALNPLEATIQGINTNGYLIGVSMLMLNLGGRHLALGLTPEQDKFFQNVWIRRALLFVVIFVGTRNIFTAFWLTLGVVLVIGYLLNEHSSFYLFGEPVEPPSQPVAVPTTGLTSEEQNIYRSLHEKVTRVKDTESLNQKKEKKPSMSEAAYQTYSENMKKLQGYYS
jgi:hypothetical protein